MLVFMHQAAEYQNRRAEQKRKEETRRADVLKHESVDITPKNGADFPFSTDASFEKDWSMKPVMIKGVFDHPNEIQVDKIQNGEKGVQIVTPFYTHLDKNGEPSGILVNRGWVP